MSNLTQQVIKSAFWQMLLKLVLIVLRLIFLAVVSRILSERDFGIIQAVTTIVYLITQIGMLGLGRAIIQRAEIDYRHISVAFWSFVVLGLLLSIALWLSGKWIASTMHIPELYTVINFIFLLPLILSLGGLSRHLLMKEMEFKRLALYEFIAFFIGYFVVGILMAYNGFGYWSLVAATCGEAIVATALIYAFNPAAIRFYFNLTIFKNLFSYGGLDSLAQIAGLAGNKVDTFFINAGYGIAVLGTYNRATALTNTNINIVSEVIDKVFFSAFSKKSIEQGQFAGFLKANIVLAFFSIPFAAFCILASTEIVDIVLGSRWTSVAPAFMILCVSIPFRLLNKVGLQLLRAQGNMTKVVINQFIYLLSSIIFLFVALKGEYLLMVSMITLSYIFIYFVTTINVKIDNKSFNLFKLYLKFRFPIIVSLIFIVFCVLLNQFSLFLQLSVYFKLLIKISLICALFIINMMSSDFKLFLKDLKKLW